MSAPNIDVVQSTGMAAPASFETLPRELRDKICEYAFQPEFETSKIVWRKEWRDREMRKRERTNNRNRFALLSAPNYEIRRFPGNPLQPMLVSKQFFQEAARAWFRKATLEFSKAEELDQFIQKLNYTPISSISTIRVEWECSKYAKGIFAPNLRWCTGLQRLHVTVVDGINVLEDKVDFIDDLDASDFEPLQLVHDVSVAASISELEIVAGKHKLISKAQETMQYSKNLEALRDYIMMNIDGYNKHISLASQSATTDSSCMVEWLQEEKSVTWSNALFGAIVRVNEIPRMPNQDDSRGPEESSIVESLEDDLEVSREGGDTVMTDIEAKSGSDSRRRDTSMPRGRALASDTGHWRIAKSSSERRERSGSSQKHHRPRFSGKELAVGGVLILNTVVSLIVLYRTI